MPTVGSPPVTATPTAGGVLAGTYPNPVFAASTVTRATANSKAARAHQHNAATVTGNLPASSAPTSTATTSDALARADDPRLSNARTWDLYSLDAYPVTGQAPTWNNGTYFVDYLPTTRPLPDAGTAQKGAVRLTNHFRGTAAAPQLFWRGPRDGVTKIDSDGYIVAGYYDASLISYARVVINHIGPSGGDYDFFMFDPSNGVPGQQITLEATTVRFPEGNNTVGRLYLLIQRGNNADIPPVGARFEIPLGKYLIVNYYYSITANRWVIIDSTLEA